MIRIAVCDDEQYMSDKIGAMVSDFFRRENPSKHLAGRHFEIQVTQFSSGQSLLDSDRAFDMLFLDIQMKDIDGIETARRLRSRGFQGYLIFTTILKEMVFHPFEVQAYDYLVKPIEEEHFRRTMERLLVSMQKDNERKLLVQKGYDSSVIFLDEIVYCEIIGRKVYLHLTSSEVIDFYDRIENLETKLGNRFYRYHITVVRELLQNSRCHEALAYVSDMEEITEEMSFLCSTGNPVVDILLGDKLGIAKSDGIDVHCSLTLPYPCPIRDIDFCIILSNALDNAICACDQVQEQDVGLLCESDLGKRSCDSNTMDMSMRKFIRVTGNRQGDFILIEIENSFQGRGTFREGTGLSNIRKVAEKCQGAVNMKCGDGVVVLSVLLIIS